MNKNIIDEKERLHGLFEFERQAWSQGYKLVAGFDEAGRGPLVGPVVAACVVFKDEVFIQDLNDSKKLSEKKRERIFDEIMDKAQGVGVGIVDEGTIDDINILNATKLAMKLAIDNMVEEYSINPDFLLIDAVKLTDIHIEQLSIIKGDLKSASIAGASIIAKVTRDKLMESMHEEFPIYNFKKHKGYGTKEHREALIANGPCKYHRKTFIRKILEG